jgi:hypothetical protein
VDKDASRQKWHEYINDMVRQFRELRNAPDTWTIPFAPWCGEQYWDASPRILFVGKSVGAFNDDEDAKDWQTPIHKWREAGSPKPIDLTNNYIGSNVAVFKTANSAFWVIPFLIAGAFSPVNIDPENLAHSFAWSNVYKVGNSERAKNDGLPTPKDLKCKAAKGLKCRGGEEFCLIHASAEWLKQEINILQPDFVLLGIGRKEWKKAGQALAIPKKSELELPIKLSDSEIKQLDLRYKPKGIWVTYHFSSWSARYKDGQHGKLLLEMRKSWEREA